MKYYCNRLIRFATMTMMTIAFGISLHQTAPATAHLPTPIVLPAHTPPGPFGAPLTCWRTGGHTRSATTISTTADSRTDDLALKLTATAVTRGSAKAILSEHQPECLQPVTPGERYQISGWLKTDQTASLPVFLHQENGKLRWWAQTRPVSPAGTWQFVYLITDPVPAGVSHLSAGVGLHQPGSVVMDGFAIVHVDPDAPADNGPVLPPGGGTPGEELVSGPAPNQTIAVADAAQLQAALDNATPGDTIRLAPGIYPGNFTINRSGAADNPITVTGPRTAILRGKSVKTGYVFHFDGARHVHLQGVTITRGQKVVVFDQASHNIMKDVKASHSGNEAVLLRNYSKHNKILDSDISHAGLINEGYGEGVYIGLAKSNWAKPGQSVTGGKPDTSSFNTISGNTIYRTTAECIDVKEGTSGGVISNNTLIGNGITGAHYADSLIDIKGNGYTITGNTGRHGHGVVNDGFQTHVVLAGWGRNNTFNHNQLALDEATYGIRIHRPDGSSTVSATNHVTGTTKGLTNIPTSP